MHKKTSRSELNKENNLNLSNRDFDVNESKSIIVQPICTTDINYEELLTKLEEPYRDKEIRINKLVRQKLIDNYKIGDDLDKNKIDQIIYNKNTNLNSNYKDNMIINSINEFLRRYNIFFFNNKLILLKL